MDITPALLVDLMFKRAALLDEKQKELHESLEAEAHAEAEYRKEKAKAWAKRGEGPALEREALVNGDTAEYRRARDLATARSKSAMEAVRSVRQQLSMLQSAASAVKEEAALARVGPDI